MAKTNISGKWRITEMDLHPRKTGFMAGFEEIVSGSGEKPSFLERAKARWDARQPGDG